MADGDKKYEMMKRNGAVTILILVFFAFAVYATYRFEFIELGKAISITLRWLGVIAAGISGFFVYHTFFKKSWDNPLWKRILVFPVLTAMFFLLVSTAFTGYVIFINGLIGHQNSVEVTGQIVKLDIPERKRLLNNYEIEVLPDNGDAIIKIVVPTKSYQIGQKFEKVMQVGCFGIKYSH